MEEIYTEYEREDEIYNAKEAIALIDERFKDSENLIDSITGIQATASFSEEQKKDMIGVLMHVAAERAAMEVDKILNNSK